MAEELAPETEIDVDTLTTEQVSELKKAPPERPAKKAEPKAKEEPKPVEKTAAVEDDGDDDEPAPAGKEQTVPHAKFHRANERAKSEAKRAADAEARANLAMQRMTELLQAQQPAKTEEPEVDFGPDPDADPIGWAKWRREKDREEYHARQQWEQQTAQQREQAAFTQNAIAAVTQEYNASKGENPQVEAAYTALRQSYAAELQALGWQGVELGNKLNELETGFILYAYQNRIPIQDVVLNLAQARGAWRPQAQAQPAEQIEDTPRDAAGRFAKAAEDMARREETKKAAKSLNGAGSAIDAGNEIPTPQQIVDMTEEEFAAFKKKYSKPDGSNDALRRAFGG